MPSEVEYAEFIRLKFGVMLCTDVMGRDVDIPKVDWVIQFDLPSSAASFVHRCGRTTRSGNVASAIIMLMPSEVEYAEFIRLKFGVMLCTDVMSRGVDIPKVDCVIQFDPPSSAASFVHRCGRTARSGNVGSAIIMLMPSEVEYAEFIRLKFGIMLCTDVMGRGVDIPKVDWVIQFDPSSSAASFVHRCGRTARSGNVGSAIIMLMPSEVEYAEFIRLKFGVMLCTDVMGRGVDIPKS